MLSLKQLDSIFDSIWLLPEKLPTAIAAWQEMLEVYLSDKEQVDSEQLPTYMDKWRNVMAENKILWESHQQDLANQLKEGEPSFSKKQDADKFKGH